MDSWSVLPDNMRFFEDENGQVCLDLTQTNIKKVGEIYLEGVDKIIMPPTKMTHHRRRPQMVHSKPRIYE